MSCLSSTNWGSIAQWVSGSAALLAVIYALFRDNISHYWQRPKLEFLKIVKTQQNSIWIYRLAIKNNSRHVAKNIEFDLYGVLDNGINRENFLPAPHSWTHHDKRPIRDIYPHQTSYLDIITTNELNIPVMLYTPVLWSIPEIFDSYRRNNS